MDFKNLMNQILNEETDIKNVFKTANNFEEMINKVKTKNSSIMFSAMIIKLKERLSKNNKIDFGKYKEIEGKFKKYVKGDLNTAQIYDFINKKLNLNF